jgi:hypothetical protein
LLYVVDLFVCGYPFVLVDAEWNEHALVNKAGGTTKGVWMRFD